MPWEKALELPGAAQMKHVHDLFTSLKWWTLRPAMVRPGKDASEAVAIAASAERDLVIAYLPKGGPFSWPSELKPAARLKAEWFDPITGKRHKAEPKDGGGYDAPDDKQDWLLILQ
jgi:Putative collagen-binding domain of a collagenase